MKKTMITLLLLVFCFNSIGLTYEFDGENKPLPLYKNRVMIDGKYTKGIPPIHRDKQVLLPLRSILEGSGFTVGWNQEERKSNFQYKDEKQYILNINNKELSAKNDILYTDSNMQINDGNTYVSPEFFSKIDNISVSWDEVTQTAIVTSQTPVDNLYFYNLGEDTIKTQGQNAVKYKKQGVLGVPNGENRPIAIILHGAHLMKKAGENRYDAGFSYLVKDLADNGYLTLSIDVGINYSFEGDEPSGSNRTCAIVASQIALLQEAINGKNSNFPVDLTKKGDLNNVILIGHSRGGTDIFDVADYVKNMNTVGFLSIAPALYKDENAVIPDKPIGIIIP